MKLALILVPSLTLLGVNGENIQVDWTWTSGTHEPEFIRVNVCDTIQFQSSPNTTLNLMPKWKAWRDCDFTDAVPLGGPGMRSIMYNVELECQCEEGGSKIKRLLASEDGCTEGKKARVKVIPVFEKKYSRCLRPRCGATKEFKESMSAGRCKTLLKKAITNGEPWLGYQYKRSAEKCKFYECHPGFPIRTSRNFICERVKRCEF